MAHRKQNARREAFPTTVGLNRRYYLVSELTCCRRGFPWIYFVKWVEYFLNCSDYIPYSETKVSQFKVPMHQLCCSRYFKSQFTCKSNYLIDKPWLLMSKRSFSLLTRSGFCCCLCYLLWETFYFQDM